MIKLFCIQQQGKTISSVLQSYFPLPHIRGKMLVFFGFCFPIQRHGQTALQGLPIVFLNEEHFLLEMTLHLLSSHNVLQNLVIMDEVRAMFLSLTQVLILHFRCQIKLPISLAFLAGDARNQRANPEIRSMKPLKSKLDQST